MEFCACSTLNDGEPNPTTMSKWSLYLDSAKSDAGKNKRPPTRQPILSKSRASSWSELGTRRLKEKDNASLLDRQAKSCTTRLKLPASQIVRMKLPATLPRVAGSRRTYLADLEGSLRRENSVRSTTPACLSEDRSSPRPPKRCLRAPRKRWNGGLTFFQPA